MGNRNSKPKDSLVLISDIRIYINTIEAIYPQDNSQISVVKFNTIRKNITKYTNKDYTRTNKDELRELLCNSIRLNIVLLYMNNLEIEVSRASKNIKLVAANQNVGTNDVQAYSQVFINEFVVNSIYRTISVLLPPKPVHIAVERYNKMVDIMRTSLNNIDTLIRSIEIDDHDKVIFDEILNNYATLQPLISGCNDNRDIDFEKNIYTPLSTISYRINDINSGILYKSISDEINKSRVQIYDLSGLTPIEITYSMLSQIMNDFMLTRSGDIKRNVVNNA
jgi:hypothetical protein